jgi:beta-lactamase class D
MTSLRLLLALLAGILLIVIGCATFDRPDSVDLQRHFTDAGYEGSTVVYDVVQDHYTIVNSRGADKALPPASTFKIFNSMVALETHVIRDENEVIKWDGVVRDNDAWNRDHNLESAMKTSCYPYFQELARRIGEDRMQQWLDRVGYGNRKITPNIDSFWLDGHLRISAKQQAQFLTRLAKWDLPFSHRSMEITRRILINERSKDYTLYAKTGWAQQPTNVGWWVGWVEKEDGHVYVFATNIESPRPDPTFAEARIQITKGILRDMGILPKTEMAKSE